MRSFVLQNYTFFCKSRSFFTKVFVFLFLIAAQVFAEEDKGRAYFIKGRQFLETGKYEEAIKYFSAARTEFNILEDYAIKYIAEAYSRSGDYKKALESIRMLLARYPNSVLKKNARSFEIRMANKCEEQNLSSLYEAYIRDYPEDEEMYIAYGKYLMQKGEKNRAIEIFRHIYAKAGQMSNLALSELPSSEIRQSDMVDRALNLIKRYNFAEAEQLLIKAQSIGPERNSPEILKNLAYSIFKQKRYTEAAELFGRIDDIYFKARSLYRAGRKTEFETTLAELINRKDRRAGYLLNVVASDKRREGDYDEALKIYSDVAKKYPDDAEDAMWGMGWTNYVSGKYRAATEIFNQLYNNYKDPKYLYWKARSLEAAGEDATELYNRISRLDGDFYGILALLRSKGSITSKSLHLQELDSTLKEKSYVSSRVETLLSLDMRSEAIAELVFASKRSRSSAEQIYIISKLQDLGEFRRSVNLANNMLGADSAVKFSYPLAFWDSVSMASKKYSIDPLFILSVIREESRYDANAKSPAGAYGLMQLMPQTAYNLDRGLKIGIKKTSQIFDVKSNIQLGTCYLKSLIDEFNSIPLAIAAYNAGESMVRKWLRTGSYRSVDEFIEDIPYLETRSYVKKVLRSFFQYKRLYEENSNFEKLNILTGRL